MIAIRALDGTEVAVNENAVTLVAGPYPHDLGPHTYVHGVERGALVTAEDAAALVGRLGVDPPLVKLTRPDASPVWIKAAAVSAIRPPMATEQQAGGAVSECLSAQRAPDSAERSDHRDDFRAGHRGGPRCRRGAASLRTGCPQGGDAACRRLAATASRATAAPCRSAERRPAR